MRGRREGEKEEGGRNKEEEKKTCLVVEGERRREGEISVRKKQQHINRTVQGGQRGEWWKTENTLFANHKLKA